MKEREVKVVVAIGGNGTFMGIRALGKKKKRKEESFHLFISFFLLHFFIFFLFFFYFLTAKKMENEKIQFFFIPATIDSDIHGTECIGEHTGVEVRYISPIYLYVYIPHFFFVNNFSFFDHLIIK